MMKREQNEMIMRYLEEVKKKILLNISHYAKSDSSMRSETSEDMHEAQQYEEERARHQSNTAHQQEYTATTTSKDIDLLIYDLGPPPVVIPIARILKHSTKEVDIPQNLDLLNKWTIPVVNIKPFMIMYKFLHIGMVQIAFKPLTLKGLPETFLAALRDARNLNFH
ncbi:hypothetical protein H5410_057586 [Solanum commersonii]|uniref:Uncharacterized protein n=1 Tax=Solanum commersonii TaxID=4109 RepID=A0A9J5WQL5_SOLCO|nr:hypothetical protein H5410_057586 [Solanum commersonii]